jgi:hypothetical protein
MMPRLGVLELPLRPQHPYDIHFSLLCRIRVIVIHNALIANPEDFLPSYYFDICFFVGLNVGGILQQQTERQTGCQTLLLLLLLLLKLEKQGRELDTNQSTSLGLESLQKTLSHQTDNPSPHV